MPDQYEVSLAKHSVDIGDYHYHPEVVGKDSPYVPLERRCSVFQDPVLLVDPKQSCLDGSLPASVSYDGLERQVFPKSRFLGYAAKRQRGRTFHRAKSGVLIARHRGQTLRWLTLTTWSGYDSSRLSPDLQVFVKRIEHVSYSKDGFNPFKMEFVKVNTDEGNGVTHALYKALPLKSKTRQVRLGVHCRRRKGGRPVNPKFDIGYIPFEWLKRTWAEITGNPNPNSQNVYIEYVRGSAERVAGYLCQYQANQYSLKRMSYSSGWLYRGCVKDWNLHFRPKVALIKSYRDSLSDEQFNSDMRALYQDWDNWILSKVS